MDGKSKRNLGCLSYSVGVSSGTRNAIVWCSIQDPTMTTRIWKIELIIRDHGNPDVWTSRTELTIDATAMATLCLFHTRYVLTVNTLSESNASSTVVEIFIGWDTFIPHVHGCIYRAGDGSGRAVGDLRKRMLEYERSSSSVRHKTKLTVPSSFNICCCRRLTARADGEGVWLGQIR